MKIIDNILKKKCKWVQTGNGNSFMKGDDFYISFNPSPKPLFVGMIFEMLDNGPETALCINDKESFTGTAFYILDGDFRKDYEKLIQLGKEACLKFYFDHPEAKSRYSTERIVL